MQTKLHKGYKDSRTRGKRKMFNSKKDFWNGRVQLITNLLYQSCKYKLLSKNRVTKDLLFTLHFSFSQLYSKEVTKKFWSRKERERKCEEKERKVEKRKRNEKKKVKIWKKDIFEIYCSFQF